MAPKLTGNNSSSVKCLLGHDNARDSRRRGEKVVRHADVHLVLPLVELVDVEMFARLVAHDDRLHGPAAGRRRVVDEVAQADHTRVRLHVLPALEDDALRRVDEHVQCAVVGAQIGVDGNDAESHWPKPGRK